MNLLTTVKEKLEAPQKGAATTQATLKDLLIVTWALPAETLRPLVPERLALDRLPSAEGELMGFVQATFSLRMASRWSPLPAEAGESYHQADVRILTRSGGKRGAYVLKAYVGNETVHNTLFPVSRAITEARFSVFVAGNPARSTFEKMTVRVTAESLDLHLAAEKIETPELTDFGRWTDFAAFLTDREEICHPARVPKSAITLLPSHLTPPTPLAGRCTLASVAALGGLTLGEATAVCYVPSVEVTGYAARPFKDS